MSLLMEALKKAERAKQQQGKEAQETESPPAAPDAELALLPREQEATQANREFPPIVAAQDIPALPDLEPPHEPVPDVAPAEAVPPDPELVLAKPLSPPPAKEGAMPGMQPETAPSPPADGTRPPAPRTTNVHKASAQNGGNIAARQKAKSVFSAKQAPRSRTLWLAGVAAAVTIGLVAFGIYYWRIVSSGGVMAPLLAVPAPTGIPADSAPPPRNTQAVAAPEAGGKPAAPVQPTTSAAPAAYDSARTSVRSGSESFRAYDSARAPAHSGSESSSRENPAIRIRQTDATNQLNPSLGKAYQSFLAGDIDAAQQQYHKVLQQEPNNRDALLGMAAIAINHKQAGQAAAYYGKLLDLDPSDPEALAGLIGLQGQTDPVQNESRLKKILAQNPQAGAAHFALGNLYSQQSRWSEAQQAYFRAYSSTPNNADYAFNLAVSLDILNQGRLALDYYRRALNLAQNSPASFDKTSVQNRIKELHTTPHGLEPVSGLPPASAN